MYINLIICFFQTKWTYSLEIFTIWHFTCEYYGINRNKHYPSGLDKRKVFRYSSCLHFNYERDIDLRELSRQNVFIKWHIMFFLSCISLLIKPIDEHVSISNYIKPEAMVIKCFWLHLSYSYCLKFLTKRLKITNINS